MDRDQRFEIQYLISLIIAVVGVVAANDLQNYFDIWVAHFLLILIFLHLVIFNVAYTLSSMSDFEIGLVGRMQDGLRLTLVGVTVVFSFFVFHIIGTSLLGTSTGCGTNLNSHGEPPYGVGFA